MKYNVTVYAQVMGVNKMYKHFTVEALSLDDAIQDAIVIEGNIVNPEIKVNGAIGDVYFTNFKTKNKSWMCLEPII